MPNTHAVLSPSGSTKWVNCAGAPAMERGHEDSSSEAADEGTAAHFLASTCLELVCDASGFLGQTIEVRTKADGDWAEWADQPEAEEYTVRRTFEVDDTMVRHVQSYLDKVREYQYLVPSVLLVEQQVPIAHITGEGGATGTADAVLFSAHTLRVHDLKYGMKQVEATDNTQLLLYALGAYHALPPAAQATIRDVVMVIHQPRLGHYPEWSITVKEMLDWGESLKAAAAAAVYLFNRPSKVGENLIPGEWCQKGYCKARATCPALASAVIEAVEALPATKELTGQELGDRASKLPMIRDWCDEVEAKLQTEVLSGHVVPGFKAVTGKKGNRAWGDKEFVELYAMAEGIDPDVMYAPAALLSPAAVENKVEKGLTKYQWDFLKACVTQSEGKPTVVPDSDKRPALDLTAAAAGMFEDIRPGGEFHNLFE